MDNTKIHPWSTGRDPEEFGWVFDETGANVDGHTISYETPDREAAIDHGIPESVLDAYEESSWYSADAYGFDLCNFMQDL